MKVEIDPVIHGSADVKTSAIGSGTRIWQNVVVFPGATIGSDCNICAHCLVENDVVLGDRVTLKCGVYLWDGIRIGNDVFIGPNATFTNDRWPRSRQPAVPLMETYIEDGASIGAAATILPGLRIGRHSMIGAGAVVTRSVPPNAIVVGNPARIIGYVDAADRQQEPDLPHGAGVVRSIVPRVQLCRLPRLVDMRGSISVGEFGRSIPFEAKRYFLVFDVPSRETRGAHAHRVCEQFLVCVRGSLAVVADDGLNRQEFMLNQPDLGLYLPPMVWGIQYKFSLDAVLLVLASHYYDPADYIRSYDDFTREVRREDDSVS